MPRQDNFKICVVGSGVIGLSTALCLLEKHKSLDVTVVSDKEFSEITSFGPPGIHRPSAYPERPELNQWARTTFDRVTEIYSGPQSGESGIQLISGNLISDDYEWLKDDESGVKDIVFNFRWLTKRELSVFPVKYKYGTFYTTFTSQGNQYVPWLKKQFLQLGGRLEKRKIQSFLDLAGEFDLVINCAGMGGGVLSGDDSMFPVRGVLLQVEASWMKHFLFAGDNKTYIIPGKDLVFVGGLRDEGESHRNVTEQDRNGIWTRAVAAVPSLKGSKIVHEWAGLRPFRRSGPRLEMEKLDTTKPLKVSVYSRIVDYFACVGTPTLQQNYVYIIHNYGHGASGFIMSWGSANVVNDLFVETHRQSSKL